MKKESGGQVSKSGRNVIRLDSLNGTIALDKKETLGVLVYEKGLSERQARAWVQSKHYAGGLEDGYDGTLHSPTIMPNSMDVELARVGDDARNNARRKNGGLGGRPPRNSRK